MSNESLDDEFANRMRAAADDDPETSHMAADDLLCELLERLGFVNTISEYRKVHKWYA